MPDIKRLWPVITPSEETLRSLWNDPAIQDDEHRLHHFCGALAEPEGYSIDQFVRIYWGGEGHNTWDAEKSKLYSNALDALEDAAARFKAAKRKYGPAAA